MGRLIYSFEHTDVTPVATLRERLKSVCAEERDSGTDNLGIAIHTLLMHKKTRVKQVGTQMLNSTIGQMNSNAVEEIVTRGVDRFNLKMDWNDEEYKKP